MNNPITGRRAVTPIEIDWNALVRWLAVGILSVLAWFALGAWANKEDRSAHDADVAAVRRDHATDITALQTDLSRILDVVCEGKPDARACK